MRQPDQDARHQRPEDLAGVPISVGYQSGSHYSTLQALEQFIPRDQINAFSVVNPSVATDETYWIDSITQHLDVPVNKIVFDVLTCSGTQEENGAVTYFVANSSVDKITDNVTRMFLGVQLQCAQCHNHPFTEWKQQEYWGMAQFFSKVRLNGNPNKAAKDGSPIAIIESRRGR